MFLDEVKASVRDWDRKWHSQPFREYKRRYDAMSLAEQDRALTLLTLMREAMSELLWLFQKGR